MPPPSPEAAGEAASGLLHRPLSMVSIVFLLLLSGLGVPSVSIWVCLSPPPSPVALWSDLGLSTLRQQRPGS